MEPREPNLLDIYKEFHNQMDKPGFRPLIRSASKIFDAPVVLTDHQYQLLSLYPAKKIGDPVYDTLLSTGGVPAETIAAFHEAYLSQPGTRYDPFFENTGLVKDCPRIFAEVYDEKKISGHVAIFLKDKKFEPWQLEAAGFLTSVIRIKMNLMSQAPNLRYETLQTLLNRNASRQSRERAADLLRWGALKPGLLLVAPLNRTKSQHAFASVAINYSLHKYPGSIPLVYNDDLVILLTSDSTQKDLQEKATSLAEYLKQYQLLAGAVYPVKDLLNLPDYYLQARLTASFRYLKELRDQKLNSTIQYYHELGPEPFFLYLSQNPETRCFIHPDLRAIVQYDQENGTDFYDTLEALCLNLFQKNETSEYLHIHRNTLNYRLNRIEEIFGSDLRDFRTLTHFLISFEMMKYALE